MENVGREPKRWQSVGSQYGKWAEEMGSEQLFWEGKLYHESGSVG